MTAREPVDTGTDTRPDTRPDTGAGAADDAGAPGGPPPRADAISEADTLEHAAAGAGSARGAAASGGTAGRPPAARAVSVPPGYRYADVIGRGGMGEVVLAEDLRLGRAVAIKRMRAASPSAEAVARFLREARVQARLDHPAIVPVHALGHDPDGRPYFTMKRLAGVTLDRVIEQEAAQAAAGHPPAHRLLRAFVDVCLAIELAHARGVIHRDLKPANIMLGDYGEVYVLDWGVARVEGEREVLGPGVDSRDGETQAGAVLGTPGYISPEQVRGDEISPATDVYALGSILYEILAGVPAHPRGEAGMASTLSGPPRPPSARRPARAIAPELEAACMRALAEEPEARPKVRGLADEIQRYLDGDRDLGRRRALAGDQLAAARAAVATGDPARRGEAMSAAGRALALDPESGEAARLVTQLMLEPPRELPPALAERLEEVDRESIGRQAGSAARALAAFFLFIPVALWAGVQSWDVLGAIYALLTASVAGAVYMARRRTRRVLWAVILNSLVLMLLTRVLSPLVIVPGIASGVAVALVAFPSLIHRPWIVIGAALAGFLVPLGLEAASVWARTWELVDGRLVITAAALRLEGAPAVILLVCGNAAMVVVMGVLVRSLAMAQRAGQRALEIQAWHLGQLLPRVEPPAPPPETPPAPAPPPPRP